MIKEVFKSRILTQHVEDGFAESDLRKDAFSHAIAPRLEFPKRWARTVLAEPPSD